MTMRSSALLYMAVLSLVLTVGATGCRRNRAQQPQQPSALETAREQEKAAAAALAGGADDEKLSAGAKKWRDVGVYVDGKPIGVLSFGELPIGLQPVWVEEQVSAEKRPGSNDPGYRIVKQRRYRFTDYLKVMGVPIAKVKEIHVYGPRFTESIIATGKDLMSKKANGFAFRFGGEVGGKPIPIVPTDFGNDMGPDKASAVMVYVEKKPPTLVNQVGFQLDGKTIDDVPYYGEPVRGGIRIYEDNKLAMVIKRPLLRQTPPLSTAADGTSKWKLGDVIAKQGLDTSKMVDAWLIHNDRRTQRVPMQDLLNMTFEMGEKERNEIFLGDKKLPASAIAFHSHMLKQEELPKILPEEEM